MFSPLKSWRWGRGLGSGLIWAGQSRIPSPGAVPPRRSVYMLRGSAILTRMNSVTGNPRRCDPKLLLPDGLARRFLLAVLVLAAPAIARPAELPAAPNRLEWFQQAKFGLFLHWGPYA